MERPGVHGPKLIGLGLRKKTGPKHTKFSIPRAGPVSAKIFVLDEELDRTGPGPRRTRTDKDQDRTRADKNLESSKFIYLGPEQNPKIKSMGPIPSVDGQAAVFM